MVREAQRRIFPEVRIREKKLFDRIIGVLCVLLGLVVGIGGIVVAQFLSDPLWLVWVLPLLTGLVLIYYGLREAGLSLWEWVAALLHHRTWRQQGTADGRILGRTIEEHKDSYNDVVSYTYWVTFRFDAAEGPVTLKARVEKGYYSRLRNGAPVAVRYALKNHRLALLEGEWDK